MILLEKFSEGKKGNPDICEDLYVITDDFAAVIDGATSVSGKMYDGKTPGRLAAEAIKKGIETLAPDATVKQTLLHINQCMQEMHERFDLKKEIEKNSWKAPSASLVLYHKHHQQVWQIGDCQFMLDGVLFQNEKEVDSITANARSLFLEAELKKGKETEELMENDTGWEFIQPLIRQQYSLQNDLSNQYGFEVANGFLTDEESVKVVSVPIGTQELVLASDGYPFLKDSLKKSEAALLLLMEEDPLCFRLYKAPKGLVKGNRSFDDRLYLKLSLVNN